jgi:hypothetical protein
MPEQSSIVPGGTVQGDVMLQSAASGTHVHWVAGLQLSVHAARAEPAKNSEARASHDPSFLVRLEEPGLSERAGGFPPRASRASEGPLATSAGVTAPAPGRLLPMTLSDMHPPDAENSRVR